MLSRLLKDVLSDAKCPMFKEHQCAGQNLSNANMLYQPVENAAGSNMKNEVR